jgi:hypothetical protein
MVKFPGNVIYCLVLMAQIDPLLSDTKGFNGKKHFLCHEFLRLQTSYPEGGRLRTDIHKKYNEGCFLLSIKENDSYWN